MKIITLLLAITFLSLNCSLYNSVVAQDNNLLSFLSYDPVIQTSFEMYSDKVKDTFNIFVSMPKDYSKTAKVYPAIYVLDANVAFEMIVTIMKLQSNGLDCKQAIYIGIGYKDILAMDSLRERDYTFPHEEEFPVSGGGEKFSMFLQDELIPKINSEYRINSNENTIIGHSASGYFVIYNLLSSAIEDRMIFKNYIAGSPFVGNDQYFIDLEQKLANKTDSLPIKLFMCSGTIEDTDSIQIVFSDIIKQRDYYGLNYKSVILNDFDHMDALIPTWSKGLRYVLKYK